MSFSARREGILLVLIVLALCAALAAEARLLGVTVDEPGHIMSAHLYWNGQDTLEPGDMPPLIKIAGGWVTLLFDMPVPRDRADLWELNQESPLGAEMLQRMSDTPDLVERFLWCVRLPFLLFPAGTMLLLWWWARQLWGGTVALLLAAAFALEPTALGHGVLFKNDLAATFTYLLFWYRGWRLWRDPSRANVIWLSLALGSALLAKLSLAILIGIAPVIVASRFAVARWPGMLAILMAGAYGVVALAYQSPWPAAYARGLASIWASNGDAGGVYLWGQVLDSGHPLYFIAALAVKMPVAVQVLIVAGAFVLAARWRRRAFADLFWIVPPILYIGLASAANLQLGVRLILPALPFGLLIAGAGAHWLMTTRRTQWAAAALMIWLAVASARIFPHGISYFNEWAGGPENGLHYLADSNIGWGQGLPALAGYVREQRIAHFHLSYFGYGNPWRFFGEDKFEIIPPPWDPSQVDGTEFKPEPGVYAISANLLAGFLFAPAYRDYYRFFRDREPVARVANSIYIYRVD